MQLNESALFIIRTIAIYTFLDKFEKRNIITKEDFDQSYENLDDLQKMIINRYIEEENAMIQNFTEKMGKSD